MLDKLQIPKDTPYWWDTVEDKYYPKFSPSTSKSIVDFVVIGAGFTGLSAAYTLAKAGKSVVCVDQNQPGFGASTRNGGMIGSGHKVSYETATRLYGAEAAQQLVSEGLSSVEHTVDLIKHLKIDCDYQQTGRFRMAWSIADYHAMQKEVKQLKGLNDHLTLVDPQNQHAEIVSPHYFGGLIYHQHGGLNPRKLHDGLADAATEAGALVFADTPVIEIKKNGLVFSIRTPAGVLRCNKVIMATNGYTRQSFAFWARRILPIPSFIIATEPTEQVASLLPGKRMMVETRSRHCYYRASPDGKRLILGARAAFTNIPQAKATATLRNLLNGIFPSLANINITHSWRGYTGFTFDHIPHVGCHEDIYYAMGYSGSGVAMAPYLGNRVATYALSEDQETTVYTKTRFYTRPYYRGRTWFLPALNVYYACKDVIENHRQKKDKIKRKI